MKQLLFKLSKPFCLIFIVYFLVQIANFRPSDEDLDYPGKLERSATSSANVSFLLIAIITNVYFLFNSFGPVHS
jgi:hypothetical protein